MQNCKIIQTLIEMLIENRCKSFSHSSAKANPGEITQKLLFLVEKVFSCLFSYCIIGKKIDCYVDVEMARKNEFRKQSKAEMF